MRNAIMQQAKKISAALLFGTGLLIGQAGQAADLERYAQYDASSTFAVNYQPVDAFLQQYTVEKGNRTYLYYEAIEGPARSFVFQVVGYLRKLPVEQLNKDEQLAYWLNLYMFESIRQVISNDVPRSVDGLVQTKWSEPSLAVGDQRLSLKDIEDIIRINFSDEYALYGLSVPAKDAPAFPAKAYRGKTVHEALHAQAKAYVKTSHAVRVRGKKLEISPFLLDRTASWYEGDQQKLVQQIAALSDAGAQQKFAQVEEISPRRFSWRVNGARVPSRTNSVAVGGGGGARGGGAGGGGFGS